MIYYVLEEISLIPQQKVDERDNVAIYYYKANLLSYCIATGGTDLGDQVLLRFTSACYRSCQFF